MIVLYVLGIVVTVLLICRPFTILFHELGHAIPSLAFGSNKVTLYIGSYGDTKYSWTIKLGRLTVIFIYNPLRWTKGLCRHQGSSKLSINQNILVVLCGPITSIVLASIWFYVAIKLDIHGSIKILSAGFVLSAMIDLIVNLTPNEEPIVLDDGKTTYNDGQQIYALLKYRTLPSSFFKAAKYFNAKEYAQAALAFHDIINNGSKNKEIYRHAITAYALAKEYKAPLPLCNAFEKQFKLKADDYVNIGLVHSMLDNREKGLAYYQKALKRKPSHVIALNNRGYEFNLQGHYNLALDDFNKVIKMNPKFAYAYNNRGLAKIKLGQVTDGLADIKTSMELDKNNAYSYKNLGIYYFDLGEYKNALVQFEKCYDLDPKTHQLAEYLNRTRLKLKT